MVYLNITLQEYSEVQLEISNMLINIIEKNNPYKWMPNCKPFVNRYNGKISYDNSGEVCRMNKADLKKIIEKIEKKQVNACYCSRLEALLEEIKVDRWIATYQPNNGKHWVSYNDILKGKFKYWKYNNSEINNVSKCDGGKLTSNLDNIFLDFIENASYKFYSAKFLMEINK